MSALSAEHPDAALARVARRAALVSVLDDPAAVGMARPGLVRARGPDAPRFLHSQLTNEVEKLEPGQGNLQARVARTGHVEQLLSLHRAPGDGEPELLLLTERVNAEALIRTLDAFLFSDVLTLQVDDQARFIAVQGPAAPAICEAACGPLGFEPWDTLPEHAVRPLRRARGGITLQPGAFAIRRSLGGDAGFLLLLDEADPALPALADALADAAAAHGGQRAPALAFSGALEILRLEAGVARIGPETTPKRRLLPETGMEQSAVSYTKGCYLGQEVIARVRTYGSVPTLLRALLLEGTPPAPGEDLLLEGGERVGTIASQAWSVVREAPVALAYLDRAWRTPGRRLTFQGPAGPWSATVAALPLHHAADAAARVQQLYDDAVRTYADGDTDGALALMEETLRIDAGFADAYEAIGVILGKAGRFHEAIDFFRRLEEVAPDEPMVNTNLSLYYMKIGDKETAEDESGKATLKQMTRARGKGSVDADLEASKRKDAARKREMFKKVLAFDEVDPIALFGLGTALLTLGEAAEAADTLARAIAVDKNNSAVYLTRGKALEKLGRFDDAVEVWRAGIEVASRKGDRMPLKEMEHRLLLLGRR